MILGLLGETLEGRSIKCELPAFGLFGSAGELLTIGFTLPSAGGGVVAAGCANDLLSSPVPFSAELACGPTLGRIWVWRFDDVADLRLPLESMIAVLTLFSC